MTRLAEETIEARKASGNDADRELLDVYEAQPVAANTMLEAAK
jgi:hypothetical protein